MGKRIDKKVVDNIVKTVRGLIDRGDLPSCQVALACNNEILLYESFGTWQSRDSEITVCPNSLYA